jgi:hypothetical protein
MEASSMTINPKDIYRATDGHIYSFDGYGGSGNCSKCDNDTFINDYVRDDGLVVAFCKRCEDGLKL